MPSPNDRHSLVERSSKHSKQQQMRNGLRLGIGAGSFLLALMLLDLAFRKITGVSLQEQLTLSNWISWLEVGVACVLLFATADVWLLLLGGYALFALGKGLLVTIIGKEFYSPYRTVPRLDGSLSILLALAMLLLLLRFRNTHPTVPDRAALTFYVVAFSWSMHKASSASVDVALVSGTVGLALAWCFYKWKEMNNTRADTTA